MAKAGETFTPSVIEDLRAIKSHFGEHRPTETFTAQMLLAARDFVRQDRPLKRFQDLTVAEIIEMVEEAH